MVNGIGGVGSFPATESSNSLGSLGSDAFLRLLVAQLRYQNPMSPADGTQMLQQTAQFTTVETLKSISLLQQQMIGFQQVSMAVGMVGQNISAVDDAGVSIGGVVDAVVLTSSGPLLRVGSLEIPLDQVVGVGPG